MPGTATGTNRSHFRQAARKNVIADNPHGSCMPGDESLAQPDVRWRRKYVRGSSLPGGVDLTDDSHSREWRRGAWLWVGVGCLMLDRSCALCASGSWSRSEEHTSELQSLMRISYAVFCLKKKTE